MNSEEIVRNVLSIVSSNTMTEDVALSDNLRELGVDSLNLVDLIVDLEDTLNIKFDDSDLDIGQISTVKDVTNMVKKGLNHEKCI